MRWVRWVLVPVLATAGALVVAAGPAMAVPGLVTVSSTGPTDPDAKKFQSVSCPPTLVVLAGGGEVVYGNSSVRLIVSRPGPGDDSWQVWAHAIGAYGGGWALRAWAVCAPEPAGYTSSTVKVVGSPVAALAEIACPAGRQVLGLGGAALLGSEAVIDEIAPLPGLGGVRVVVRGDGTVTPYPLTAEADVICATPVPGLQAVSTSTALNSSGFKTIGAFCPAGTRPHGGGADIVGGLGAVHLDGIGYSAAGVYAQAREHLTPYPEQWSLTVYALCAI